MHRTNIYLTEAHERALDARARATGRHAARALRAVLDDALSTGMGPGDDELAAAFASIVDDYDAVVEALFADDDDLRIDR